MTSTARCARAASEQHTYVGLDIAMGPGVDLVIEPEQPIPLQDEFADLVISSSQLEHDTFFWQTFLQLCRITKDGGYIYLNAPSNGNYHRYPQDVWRFYPDAGVALAKWARTNGFDVSLVESFIAHRKADIWNDFVAVFAKGKLTPPRRLISDSVGCENIHTQPRRRNRQRPGQERGSQDHRNASSARRRA